MRSGRCLVGLACDCSIKIIDLHTNYFKYPRGIYVGVMIGVAITVE